MFQATDHNAEDWNKREMNMHYWLDFFAGATWDAFRKAGSRITDKNCNGSTLAVMISGYSRLAPTAAEQHKLLR